MTDSGLKTPSEACFGASFQIPTISLLLIALAITLTAGTTFAAVSGAIYTTNKTATIVNGNTNYANATDVYISGGPQNKNDRGLEDGTYYFQVTDPSGATLLSTDNAVCRQLSVVGGRVVGSTGPSCKHANGTFNPANGVTPVQLVPFSATPNNGDVYKAWVVPVGSATISTTDPKVLIFAKADDKTDNFKVPPAIAVPLATSSGSTGIIPGVVNGQLVDKAYVPISSFERVAVINIDSTTPAALIKSISMPLGYHPNATAASPVTQQVVVISYTSPDVQIIDGSLDVFVGTVTSTVTRFAGFSGGACMICGVLIDTSTNSAILDTAQGYVLLNLATRQFSSFLSGTVAGENFGFNPTSRIVLNPTYGQGVPSGLQAVSLVGGPVFTYSTFVGATPDSTAIDINTSVAVVPDEGTSNQFLINMAEATFDSLSSPPRFSAPSTVFAFPLTSCRNDWTMVSVESSTHLLFLASEFDGCAAVESLSTSIVSGAPPTPAVFRWSRMPSPDAVPWNNGGDPHGIAVFTSVVDGKPYGFLVRFDQLWVARIDLTGMKNGPLVPGGPPNQVDITPFVFFLKTQ